MAVAGFRRIVNLAWGDVLYVDDLTTLPSARRQGLGRALLDAVERESDHLVLDL